MKNIEIQIDEALASKLEIALQLTGETQDEVLSSLIKRYVSDTFAAAANSLQGAPSDVTAPNNSATTATGNPRTARRVAQPSYGEPKPSQQEHSNDSIFGGEWGKAISRIPRWAKNPQQYNHKILRAFFELQQELGLGHVTLDALRKRCSDPTAHPKTFVPHFDNNYTQMKFDNGNSHGKVFEERDGFITLWDRINDPIIRYRDYFM